MPEKTPKAINPKAQEFLTDPKHEQSREMLGDILEGILEKRNAEKPKEEFSILKFLGME